MSITDEDLQFMADAMWEDSLLPGNDGDLDFARLLSADDHVEEDASLSDALLGQKPRAATKASSKMAGKSTAKEAPATASATASTSKGKAKIDWKRSAKPVVGTNAATTPAPKEKPTAKRPKIEMKGKSKESAGDKYGVAAADAAKSKDKKMPPPQSTSPLSDLYLSSLPASLIKPKTDVKLSKSMKGASQNERQADPDNNLAPEADMLDKSDAAAALDPYGIPMSPTSKYPIHDTAQKTKTMSPATSVAKMMSPLGLIPASGKKSSKPQKRVAKRSILDAPESPEKDKMVKPAQVKPPSKAAPAPPAHPAPKQTAKSKRKPSVGKGKEKEAEKDKETKKPTAAPKCKPLKTATKEDTRSFLVPKQMKKADSPDDIPASVPDVPHIDEMTKKLRPRTEKRSIIISSDSESNYSDDDDFSASALASATGDTTIMTTPDHSVEDFTLPKLQRQQPERLTAPAVGANSGMSAGTSSKRPSKRATIEATVRPKKIQKQAGVDAMHSISSPGLGDSNTTSFAVNGDLGGLVNSRGPEAFVSEQGSVVQTQRQEKRQRSPTKVHRDNQQQKRQKLGRGLTAAHGRDDKDADADHDQLQSQGSSSKVVQSVAASDPFVGDLGEERVEQSQFTSKLLRSAAEPVSGVEQWESTRARPTNCQPQFSLAVNTPLPGRRNAPVSHIVSAESNQIARDMMQLLANGRRADPGHAQGCGPESAQDIWLNETDPYKETTQVMGYVCNTLLRFLKSKESAVEDVATEYQQRGSAVLARIKELHGKEKHKFALEFENRRQQSLEMFEEACRGVSQIAGSLERVSLVPAINDVLADDTVSRLRALQAEMA